MYVLAGSLIGLYLMIACQRIGNGNVRDSISLSSTSNCDHNLLHSSPM